MLRLFVILAFCLALSSAQLCIPTIPPGVATSVLGQSQFTLQTPATSLSAFDTPTGIVVDPISQKIFVADSANRIQRFNSTQGLLNNSAAELEVFGKNLNATCDIDNIMNAEQITIFGSTLFISDFQGNRVLRVNNATTATTRITAAANVYGRPDFTDCSLGINITGPDFNQNHGVAVTNNGTLWVSDTFNYFLKRFDSILSKGNGPNPDGLLGTGTFSPQNASNIAFASYLTLDKVLGHLFVSDVTGNRVLLFQAAQNKANFASADKVYGQPSFTDNEVTVNASITRRPQGVFYDSPTDSLFVTDLGATSERSRVLVWTNALLQPNGASASFLIGRPDFSSSGTPGTPTGSNFDSPWDISYTIDFPGLNLLVVDQVFNRVVRFECTNATFTASTSFSNTVAASSPGSSSGAALSSSPPVAPSSSGAVAPSSSGAVAPSSSGAVAPSSSGAVAASSSGAVAASSSGAVAASSGAVAASSGAVAASSVVVATQSRSKSVVVAASSSGAVAASSGAVAASSGAVAASSGAVAASSGAVAASATRSSSKSLSNTPSETKPAAAASSGAVAASSGAVAATSGAAAASSRSVSVAKTRTLTGLAAINCRQTCQIAFVSCKKTSRRLRICRRGKKQCVSQCGTVNPRN